MSNKIAIIGGGNLGTAIAEGLINSGFSKPDHILITKRNVKTLQGLQQRGVLVSDNNEEAVRFATLVILVNLLTDVVYSFLEPRVRFG